MPSTVDLVADREGRRAWIRFDRVAVEDVPESKRQGKWVGKDVDMVHITPAYGKDEVDKKVSSWLEQLDMQVHQAKIRPDWRDRYVAEYDAWKKGQELPVDGTPIKGWGVISPAQQENLIRARIRTVEDLAHINDEGQRAVGMGCVDMKQKALAWLAQVGDKGPLTIKMAAVESDNRNLQTQVNTLTKQVEELLKQVQAANYTYREQAPAPRVPTTAIAASDVLDDSPLPIPAQPPPEPIVKKKRGNPNWGKKTVPASMDAQET